MNALAAAKNGRGLSAACRGCGTRNSVTWVVELGDEFEREFHSLPEAVRMEILVLTRLLARFGLQLGRPRVDTLKGSAHFSALLTANGASTPL